MKDFNKFLEEITIKGNIGVPGEGGRREERPYLRDVEQRARGRVSQVSQQDMMNLRRYVQKSHQLCAGKETELEQLAEKIIRKYYESILDNVELDIKLLRSGNQIKNFMDEESEEEQESPSYRLLNDPEVKKHIDKAKLLNNVIQGEAKNTKNMLLLPEVHDELTEIFGGGFKGGRVATELTELWNKITKISDRFDWEIPIQAKSQLMEENPEGMAGAVKVDWKKPEPKEEDEQKTVDDILKSIEDGEDLTDNQEEVEELFNQGTPVIRARAIDFPMLLHETVKGIYELIAAASMPTAEEASEEEKKLAKTVKLNVSSFEDEAEDFRYGPEIAADLRDFINQSPNVDKYPNIREFVFGKMVDRNRFTVDEFLNLMKGILQNKPDARRIIDGLVNEVVTELDAYEKEVSKWEMGQVLGHEEEPSYEPEITKEPEGPVDYSTWSQKDLQEEIDMALDAGDYEKVKLLSQFLKEGKIYLKELEIINERLNPHTK